MTTPTYDVIGSGSAWAILDQTGRVVGLRNGDKELALRAAERLAAKAKEKVRPCITCGKPMVSTSFSHRRCAACKRKERKLQ